MAFLATLAGIWFSLLLAGAGFFLFIVIAAANASTSKPENIKDHTILKVDLSGMFIDQQPKLDFKSLLQYRDNDWQVVSDITSSIKAAAADDRIDGIVIECGALSAGITQLTSIIDALKQFKAEAPQKWIYAYADDYTQGAYYVASAADSIFVNPVGMVDIHGLSATTTYMRKLFDKVGIEMQVIKVGTYKSAVEPYILDAMSDASREQQELFLGNIWDNIRTTIAEGRGVEPSTVNEWADSFTFTTDPKDYVKSHIVDALLYRRDFNRKLADKTECKKIKDIRSISTERYALTTDNKVGNGKGANIAVLYACGEITDSEGNGIVGEDMVPLIYKLADNDDIDALVMYVNSPGGSAFASEQIWAALNDFKKTTGKPFYVSMSDYAASGGYYISCGADKIFAYPGTLTGSIGIFGIIPNVEGLFDKIGISTGTVQTNPYASFPSMMKPMTPTEKAAMQKYIDRGYDLFTKRCAEGRHMSQDSIKMIAEGRVWDGCEALKLGLVDELGGLDIAIADMAKRLNVESYTVSVYPDIEQEWMETLLEMTSQLKASVIRGELGEMTPLYEAIKRVKGLSPVQARMEFTAVEL